MFIQNSGEKQTPMSLTLSKENVGNKSRYAQKGARQAGVDEVKWALLFLLHNRDVLQWRWAFLSGVAEGGGAEGNPALYDFF